MKLKNALPILVAVGSGVITLALFFLRDLIGGSLAQLFPTLLGWATTLAAIALLAGILNLLAVHLRKVSAFSAGWVYSIVLLLFFVGMLGMWLISLGAALVPPENQRAYSSAQLLVTLGQGAVEFAFNYIQTPVEASLMAVLAVILVLAGARLIRKQQSWTAVVFIIVTLFLIVGLTPIAGLTFLSDLSDAINNFLAAGATRGILFGIALGVIATGLRVIIGVDHPYGE